MGVRTLSSVSYDTAALNGVASVPLAVNTPFTVYWLDAESINVNSSPIDTPPFVVPFKVMVSLVAAVLKDTTVFALS